MKAVQTKQQEKLSSVQKAIMARDRCLLRIGAGLALMASGVALGALAVYWPLHHVPKDFDSNGNLQDGGVRFAYLCVGAGAVFGLGNYCVVFGAGRLIGGVRDLLRKEKTLR